MVPFKSFIDFIAGYKIDVDIVTSIYLPPSLKNHKKLYKHLADRLSWENFKTCVKATFLYRHSKLMLKGDIDGLINRTSKRHKTALINLHKLCVKRWSACPRTYTIGVEFHLLSHLVTSPASQEYLDSLGAPQI